MTNKHWLAVIITSVIIALLSVTAIKMYVIVQKYQQFEINSWDENPWPISQAQIELERMRIALQRANDEPNSESFMQASMAIEIFWSRLALLYKGPNQGAITLNPDIAELAKQATVLLENNEEELINLQADFVSELLFRSEEWSDRWQQSAKSVFLLSSQSLDEVNTRLVGSYHVVLSLVLFLVLLILLLSVFLWILLMRNQYLLKQAQIMSKVKDDFFSTMNHELRTPLNGVVATISLLKQETMQSNDQSQRELIQLLDHSGEALLSQINAVLDYSQLSHQDITVFDSHFCIHHLITHCMQVCSAQAVQQGIVLSLLTHQHEDSWICADRQKIRQVLLNLISNAVKFTLVGKVDVSYQLLRQPNSMQLSITVSDTGIGIPEEQLESIFDAFSQADNSIRRQFGGSGLGLAISKKLTQAMQGSLSVESEYKQGSQFFLRLPVIKVDAVQTKKIDNFTHHSNSSFHVLLVEDNIINQKLASKILEKLGAKVSVAYNGQQAIDYPLSDIDIILMDIQMPVLDGLSATEKLRSRGEILPIIALTANTTDADKKRCFTSGMDACISKPYTIQAIQKIITQFSHHKITPKLSSDKV